MFLYVYRRTTNDNDDDDEKGNIWVTKKPLNFCPYPYPYSSQKSSSQHEYTR